MACVLRTLRKKFSLPEGKEFSPSPIETPAGFCGDLAAAGAGSMSLSGLVNTTVTPNHGWSLKYPEDETMRLCNSDFRQRSRYCIASRQSIAVQWYRLLPGRGWKKQSDCQ